MYREADGIAAFHPGPGPDQKPPKAISETPLEKLARCEREFLELALKKQMGDFIGDVKLHDLAVSIIVQRAAITG